MSYFNLPSFPVHCYEFTIEAVDPLQLPSYKGSTLRGGFGYAFKKMACIHPQNHSCKGCERGNKCPYGFIFEPNFYGDEQIPAGAQTPPVPFILEPPTDRKIFFDPGDLLSFQLVLFGRADQYLAYFLLAFQELGREGIGKRRGRYSLKRVLAFQPYSHSKEVVYDGVEIYVSDRDLGVSATMIEQHAPFPITEHPRLNFITPTRIKHDNTYCRQELGFPILVRSLLRRFNQLFYFYGEQPWESDFHQILADAKQVGTRQSSLDWVDWSRYSTRQKQDIDIGGMMGAVTYQGEIEKFQPLLALGELMHVGKATVFGNGRYRIEAG